MKFLRDIPLKNDLSASKINSNNIFEYKNSNLGFLKQIKEVILIQDELPPLIAKKLVKLTRL